MQTCLLHTAAPAMKSFPLDASNLSKCDSIAPGDPIANNRTTETWSFKILHVVIGWPGAIL